MPTLLLRFPGGRYHATPWGHHVNEGLIEWPPSPWRLLRALLSTGYTALGWEGDMSQPTASSPPPAARALFLKLANVLPAYVLPPGVGAHTRHYMPLGTLDKGREKTTLVFDTWATLGEGELAVTWDVELDPDEAAMFSRLAERLGYLGRSESWVEGSVFFEPMDEVPNCYPEGSREPAGPGWEQVAMLTAQSPAVYDDWRRDAVARALAPFPLPEKKPGKTLLELRRKAEAPYPSDLLACLQMDNTELRRHGWSQPPGSRRVFYWRRVDALQASSATIPTRRREAATVRAVLLSLSTASRNDHALPRITRTLPQAELFHRDLGHALSRLQLGHSPVLSGCDENRQPLREAHRHAHILPLDLDGDGHIEHMLIWAPMGLDAKAQAAIREARKTFTKSGVGPLKIALEAWGELDDLRRLGGVYGEGLRAVIGNSKGSTRWISSTPFVAPRYVKPRGANSLEGQIAAELASRGLPVPIEVIRKNPVGGGKASVRLLGPEYAMQQGGAVLNGQSEVGAGEAGAEPASKDTEWLHFRHFVRTRRNGVAPPIDFGHALELHFDLPISGPLALGFGSHFGLGLFAPA